MSYLITVLLIAVVPIVLGHVLARHLGNRRRIAFAALLGTLAALAAVGAWYAIYIFARTYGETDSACWQIAEWWAQKGKWFFFGIAGLFLLGYASYHEQNPRSKVRIAMSSLAVLLVIGITVWRTFPIYAFLSENVIRDANGVIRQTVPYTCGPVSLANAVELCGLANAKPTERELSRLSGTTPEGSTMQGLCHAAHEIGLHVVECRRLTMDELEAKKLPAIVFISTISVVRHAALLVKFDGDSVVFMDPDRGYWVITRQRFAQIWYGKSLVLFR